MTPLRQILDSTEDCGNSFLSLLPPLSAFNLRSRISSSQRITAKTVPSAFHAEGDITDSTTRKSAFIFQSCRELAHDSRNVIGQNALLSKKRDVKLIWVDRVEYSLRRDSAVWNNLVAHAMSFSTISSFSVVIDENTSELERTIYIWHPTNKNFLKLLDHHHGGPFLNKIDFTCELRTHRRHQFGPERCKLSRSSFILERE